ncbi:MAG TPA: hypothetical protein VE860_07180 [Chthoniobacterales bacterium]|nr:hypothetical protein [Chthoniobacterales bacterium]
MSRRLRQSGGLAKPGWKAIIWLENPNGVIIRLVAKRQGLMLTLGGEIVGIQMKQPQAPGSTYNSLQMEE